MKKILCKVASVAAKVWAKIAPARAFIAAAAYDVWTFIKRHKPLLCLITGLVLTAAAVVFAFVAGNKRGTDDPWRGWLIASVACEVVGLALTTTAYAMKAHELSAALKAIAAAANAAPVAAGTMAMAGPSNEEDVPSNLFRIRVGDMNLPDLNHYGPYEAAENLKRYITDNIGFLCGRDKNGISWNDFSRNVTHARVHDLPYGWQIGFRSRESIDLIVYDPSGCPTTWQQFMRAVMSPPDLTGADFLDYSIGFKGLTNLCENKVYTLKEVSHDDLD